ncbi:MAG: lamin tail domain-containing protein [bacterium]
MSICISGILPNPPGKDTEGEWITIINKETDTFVLDGWGIRDASGKEYQLKGTLKGKEERRLLFSETHIVLNNNQDEICLYNKEHACVQTITYENPYEGEIITDDKDAQPSSVVAESMSAYTRVVPYTQESMVSETTYTVMPFLLGFLVALVFSIFAAVIIKQKVIHDEGD